MRQNNFPAIAPGSGLPNELGDLSWLYSSNAGAKVILEFGGESDSFGGACGALEDPRVCFAGVGEGLIALLTLLLGVQVAHAEPPQVTDTASLARALKLMEGSARAGSAVDHEGNAWLAIAPKRDAANPVPFVPAAIPESAKCTPLARARGRKGTLTWWLFPSSPPVAARFDTKSATLWAWSSERGCLVSWRLADLTKAKASERLWKGARTLKTLTSSSAEDHSGMGFGDPDEDDPAEDEAGIERVKFDLPGKSPTSLSATLNLEASSLEVVSKARTWTISLPQFQRTGLNIRIFVEATFSAARTGELLVALSSKEDNVFGMGSASSTWRSQHILRPDGVETVVMSNISKERGLDDFSGDTDSRRTEEELRPLSLARGTLEVSVERDKRDGVVTVDEEPSCRLSTSTQSATTTWILKHEGKYVGLLHVESDSKTKERWIPTRCGG